MNDHPDAGSISLRAAKIWVFLTLASLVILIYISGPSYFEFDAFGIWLLSGIAVLYLAGKKPLYLEDKLLPWVLLTGLLLCILSLLSIPTGLTRPPYSIGEYSLFLSGVDILIFGFLRLRALLLPVALPALAVIGSSLYELFLRHQDWITAPLIPLTTFLSVAAMNAVGVHAIARENVITFLSSAGEPIALTIISDCTGIMSLGTFTIAVIIVLANFPQVISRSSALWILVGYIGTYLANIIRIVLIPLSGYYFGPVGVMERVHVHIGWVIFSLWMIIFWYYFFTRQIGYSFFSPPKNPS